MILMAVTAGCSRNYVRENFPPLRSVGQIDAKRYLGKWYEIARYPFYFEDGLVNTTATYSLKSNGNILVLNEGTRGSADGKRESATGEARFEDTNRTAELLVSFFGPFAADYWVVEIDRTNYSYAMVATGYSYLWILSRKPELETSVLKKLLVRAAELGFETNRLYFVPQTRE